MTSKVKTIEIINQFQYGTGEKLGYLKYDPVSLLNWYVVGEIT